MLYKHEYIVAALLICSVLFATYLIRNKHLNKSGKIFAGMIVCLFLASFFNFVSIFTISFPQKYNIIFDYVISQLYLFFCNFLYVLVFRYIDAKAKIKFLEMPSKVISIFMSSYLILSIATTPFTHFIFYLDENLNYVHGPLFGIFYLLFIFFMIMDLFCLIKGRNKFNMYQVYSCVTLLLLTFVCMVIQIFINSLLITEFAMSIILNILYITFENPNYFEYKNTQCQNKIAFIDEIKQLSRSGNINNVSFIIITLTDYDFLYSLYGGHDLDKLLKELAKELYINFKNRVYVVNDNRFVIIQRHNKIDKNIEKVKTLFEKTFITKDIKHVFSIQINTITYFNKCDFNDVELLTLNTNENIDELNFDTILSEIKISKLEKENIVHLIKNAIKEDLFEVYYQPILNVKTNKFESAEALLRLSNNGKFINSEKLIVIAERNGYIDQIDKIVFEKICKFISQNNLKELGISYIDINLSPIQCLRPNLVNEYLEIINKYNICTNNINLEITETSEFENEKQISHILNQFKEKGIKLSLDDFGSGFASANSLIKLPVDIVKIDKEILWKAMEDAKSLVVLKNMISVTKELGLKIIVEGVETKEMYELLEAEKVDYNQGYLFSKPINEQSFIEFLSKNNK